MRFASHFRFTEFQLLIAPSLMALIGLLTIFLVPRGSQSWTWSDIWVSVVFVAILFAMTFSFSLLGFQGDQILLPVTAVLAGLGLLVVQRLHPALAARNLAAADLAEKQMLYLGAGLGVLWISAIALRQLDWLRRYKYTWLLLSLALLVITFMFGEEINGARLWIRVGPVHAQPSEIVKITLVTFMAAFLADHHDVVGSSWRVGRVSLPPLPYLLPMVLMGGASLAVLVIQNDLGAALLFFGVFLAMLYVASGRTVYIVVGLGIFGAACWAAYQMFARVDIRVQNWIDPWQAPRTTGYQQVQSDYALATGGLIGTGLGKGEPYHIPAVQTDFVLSAIGEEVGLLGTLGVLALYLVLVARGLMIGLRTTHGFARLVAVGLSTVLGLQTLIIIGGVVRIIPLTGITLPFISYGGSSLLTNFLIIGLLLNISAMPSRR